jgi:hypothetical protein
MNSWVAFASGMFATLAGVWLTQHGENRRALRADRQHLRDEKAKRLRRLYEPFVKVALLLPQVARAKSYILDGVSQDEQNRQYDQEITECVRRANNVSAAAEIESGTDEAGAAYGEMRLAYESYLRLWNTTAQGGTATPDEFNKQCEAISRAADKLFGIVRKQIEEQEKPIG